MISRGSEVGQVVGFDSFGNYVVKGLKDSSLKMDREDWLLPI